MRRASSSSTLVRDAGDRRGRHLRGVRLAHDRRRCALGDAALADGCYRYTLTGTDNVGNAVTIFTTV